MAKKIYDVAVKTGTYTDHSGQEKGRWKSVGAVMKADDGNSFLMLDRTFSPAGVPDLSGRGGDSILLSLFEPKPQHQGQSTQKNESAQVDDDDVPF